MHPNIIKDFINRTHGQLEYKEPDVDLLALLIVFFVLTFIILVLVGTLLDICKKRNKTYWANPPARIPWASVLVEFSIIKSTQKIFNCHENSLSDKSLNVESIHAFKTIFMAMIILGHTYMQHFQSLAMIQTVQDDYRYYTYTLLVSSLFSVDSFFLISGLLNGFITMKAFNQRKPNVTVSYKSALFKYYWHRYIRITPTYIIVVVVTMTLVNKFGVVQILPPGPLFGDGICEDKVWANMLYINNFYIPKSCFLTGWYLSNDMQLYALAPLIMIPLGNKNMPNAALISVIISNACVLLISTLLTFNPDAEAGFIANNSEFYITWIYFKPWSRIPTFVLGLWLGYLIFQIKTQKLSNPIDRPARHVMGWIFATLCFLYALYGMFAELITFPAIPRSRFKFILYQAISKLVWSMGVAFIIFSTEFFPKIGCLRIFRWRFWRPLSNLNYSTYLIHIFVVFYFNRKMHHTSFLDHPMMFDYFLYNLVVSYVAGFLLCIFFEMPLMSLEKSLWLCPKKPTHHRTLS